MIRDSVGNVHAEKRGNQRRHHEHHRNDREAVDHQVQVIGNNAGIGIHRAVEDVRVHVRHGKGLRIIDDNVFEQVGQVFVAIDVQKIRPLHFHFQQLVGIERVNEIYQAFFNGEQLLQVGVAATVHQFLFDAVAAQVERFEAGKEVIYVLFEHLQDEAFFICGGRSFARCFPEIFPVPAFRMPKS